MVGIITSLLALLPIFAQARTVTYETKAKLLSSVLVDLSKQAHLKLSADDLLSKQPIIIHVQDVAVKDLLAHIAKISFGTWTPQEGGYELRLNSQAVQAAENAAHKKDLAKAQKVIDDAAADLKSHPVQSYDEMLANLKKLYADMDPGARVTMKQREEDDKALNFFPPWEKATDEAIIAIGAEAISENPPGQAVTYSTNPNQLQRGLGDQGADIFKKYVDSEEEWARAESQLPVSTSETQPPAEPTKAAKLILVVTFGGYDYYPLTPIDSDGHEAPRTEKRTSALLMKLTDAEGAVGYFPPYDPPTKEKKPTENDPYKLAVSDDSKQIAAISSLSFGGAPDLGSFPHDLPKDFKLPESLGAKMLHPEEADPLGFGESDELIDFAKHKGLQLAAVLPDSFLGHLTAVTARDLVDQLNGQELVSFDRDSQWMDFAPIHPKTALNERTDRAAFGKLIRAVNRPGASQVESLAPFIASHPSASAELINTYFTLVSSNREEQDWQRGALRFFGSLPEPIRQRMEQGQAFNILDLPSDVSALVNELLYQEGDLSVQSIPRPKPPVRSIVEPTELLPNGLPQDATVKLNLELGTYAKLPITNGGATSFEWDEDARGLARFLLLRENPAFAQLDSQTADLNHIHLHPVHKWKFQFTFSDKFIGEMELEESLPQSSQIYTWDTLPADFKQAVLDAEPADRKRLNRSLQETYDVKQLTGGQNPPP